MIEGSREEKLEAYRSVREKLTEQILGLLG